MPLAETEFSAALTENGAQIDLLFEYLGVDLTPQTVWIKQKYWRRTGRAGIIITFLSFWGQNKVLCVYKEEITIIPQRNE